MNCCYNDETLDACEARRMEGMPMCQRHLLRTFRDALVEGALPADVFKAISREAVEALRAGEVVRRFEMNRLAGAIRLDQEREERRRRLEAADPVVYYVQLTGGRVKIGWTTDLARRLSELRLRAADVLAIEPGGRSVEVRRHRQFGNVRIGRSEEFNPDDAMWRHIEGLRGQVA